MVEAKAESLAFLCGGSRNMSVMAYGVIPLDFYGKRAHGRQAVRSFILQRVVGGKRSALRECGKKEILPFALYAESVGNDGGREKCDRYETVFEARQSDRMIIRFVKEGR